MATDPRRFDQTVKVVSDLRRSTDDAQSTILARLASHKHVEADVTSLVADLATLTTSDAGKAVSGHTHTSIINGTPSLVVGTSSTVTNQPILWDTSWRTFSFANGWFDSNFCRYRILADGTTLFRGLTAKTANPTNGEIMFSIAYPFYPSSTMNFLTACATRNANGSQKLQIDSSGNCRVWDMAVAAGDMDLSGIRFPSQFLN